MTARPAAIAPAAPEAAPEPGLPPRLRVEDIVKSYGATRANAGISFALRPGEILGLLGANGAGKSTLIRIVSGVTPADSGRLLLDGRDLAQGWTPEAARRAGVRIVHQELSLCANLTVCENFYLENPGAMRAPLGVARALAPRVRAALERIFPGAEIDPLARVDQLTIAERQMVEIARVADDPRLSLLILDEPSSALDAARAAQLADFLKRLAARGVPSIYISHKLDEVIRLVTRIVVLKNGALAWQGAAQETGLEEIVARMGGERSEMNAARLRRRAGRPRGAVLLRLGAEDPLNATGAPLELHAGEVIGFAGLEGQGQAEALRGRIFDPRRAAFVSGDRKRDGILPAASVLENAAISAIAARGLASVARIDRDGLFGWFDRLSSAATGRGTGSSPCRAATSRRR